jgi:tetratricopeptide (TPR) repeat protein
LNSNVLPEPVLVGRENEMEKLESFLEATIKGKGGTVFLSGEAGSGKSRLSREFLASAKNKGANTLVGWCLPNSAVPYFPFIEAFNTFFASKETISHLSIQQPEAQVASEKRDVTSWLSGPGSSEKMSNVEPLSPQVWKDQAYDRVAKTLLTIATDNPVVLFLEDVHWADSASLSLLHYISRLVSSSEKILVLATFRSDEVSVDAEGRSHPLKEVMKSMSREDLFSEIELSGLNDIQYSIMARNMLGGEIQQNLIEKISKGGNGNALFLLESLRMLAEQKGIVKKDNEWRLAVDSFEIPSKIRDIILHRLGSLKYAQRRLLDAASVIGEKFSVDLLASVLNQEILDVLENLDFIAKSTAIVRDEGVCYKFDHARSREVLYEALSSSLKTGYHTRVAEKLESKSKDGKIPFADLAYHYSQTGNELKAVKYSLEAGQEALANFSNGEAIKNFQYVLDKIHDNALHLDQKTAALEGLGDALYAGNNFRQARETFEELAQFQKDKAKLRALRKAIVATFYEINPPKIIELTRLAEESLLADRVEGARILSHKARIASVTGDYLGCYPLLQESIRVYEEEYCLPDVAWDLFAMSNVYTWSGELEKGVASALRSIAMYEEIGDVHSQLEAHLYVGHCFSYCTFPQEAIKYYQRIIEIDNAYKLNDYSRLVPAHFLLGFQLAMDNLPYAKALILKALDYCNKVDSAYNRTIGSVYSTLIIVSIFEGNNDLAEEYYSKLMNLDPKLRLNLISSIFYYYMNAAYFASKKQFETAHGFIAKGIDFITRQMQCPGLISMAYRMDAEIFKLEGRIEESKEKFAQAQLLVEEAQAKFAHVNISTGLVTFVHPEVNQSFELRLDVVNASRKPGTILKIENLIVPSLKILSTSPNCLLKDGQVELKDNKIEPFSVKTIKLTVSAAEPETLTLAPTVSYIDDLNQIKTSNDRPFQIKVQPKFKEEQGAGKIITGCDELDDLLFGGIPYGSTIALVASNSDEKIRLIEGYLEAGLKNRQITFYLTDNLWKGKDLAETYPSDMWLFVCGPKADSAVGSLPNVVILNGVENLTAIDITLAKALRLPSTNRQGSKRACIEITSDVLLQHHNLITRKWLTGLVQNLRSHGFTVLAVFDPSMHPFEELQAVLSVFDGEIQISEKDTPEATQQVLKIKKLINQKFSSKEIVLTKEALNGFNSANKD